MLWRFWRKNTLPTWTSNKKSWLKGKYWRPWIIHSSSDSISVSRMPKNYISSWSTALVANCMDCCKSSINSHKSNVNSMQLKSFWHCNRYTSRKLFTESKPFCNEALSLRIFCSTKRDILSLPISVCRKSSKGLKRWLRRFAGHLNTLLLRFWISRVTMLQLIGGVLVVSSTKC